VKKERTILIEENRKTKLLIYDVIFKAIFKKEKKVLKKVLKKVVTIKN